MASQRMTLVVDYKTGPRNQPPYRIYRCPQCGGRVKIYYTR